MKYYLGLGSNLGDSKAILRRGLELIEEKKIGKVIARSHLYLTEPVGGPDQPEFVNAAAAVESALEPEAMLKALLLLESELGRTRRAEEKNFPRTLDLDILLVDDKIIRGPEITVPHPRMRERRFALEPLAEIAGEAVDPELKQSCSQILKGLQDRSWVKKLDEEL